MRTCKFKPGDRVVNTAFGSQEGTRGTVIETHWHPNTTHEVRPGVTDHGYWRIVMILDTAEKITTSRHHSWVTEEDYITGAYIPF